MLEFNEGDANINIPSDQGVCQFAQEILIDFESAKQGAPTLVEKEIVELLPDPTIGGPGYHAPSQSPNYSLDVLECVVQAASYSRQVVSKKKVLWTTGEFPNGLVEFPQG